MSTQEVFAVQFAKLFQHYREALTPSQTMADNTPYLSWKAIPHDEQHRIVAAARLALLELETNARMDEDSRRYYAKPGEAEWGC